MKSFSKHVTSDPSEILKFSKLQNDWWNIQGPLFTLHSINKVRVQYIRQWCSINKADILDVGCGGGILTHSLSKLGARVTGIDITKGSINAALAAQHLHTGSGSRPRFIQQSIEEHDEKYDLVILSEVLEHVHNRDIFIQKAINCLRPRGSLVITTINQNLLADLILIKLAESTNLVPSGTHEYEKLVPLVGLTSSLTHCGFRVLNTSGLIVIPHLLPRPSLEFRLCPNFTLLNYFVVAER